MAPDRVQTLPRFSARIRGILAPGFLLGALAFAACGGDGSSPPNPPGNTTPRPAEPTTPPEDDGEVPNAGYLHVTVSPDRVTVSYVRAVLPGDEAKAGAANGAVACSYSVSAGPPAARG